MWLSPSRPAESINITWSEYEFANAILDLPMDISLGQQISALPTMDFWVWSGLASAAAAGGFWFAFRNLVRARLIEDTPTARIHSAPQGYVELSGSAEAAPGPPAIAPLTGSDCAWFRYRIEKRGSKHWNTVEQKTSQHPFLLKDGTGECLVIPDAAEVTPAVKDTWYGYSRRPEERHLVPGTGTGSGGLLGIGGLSLGTGMLGGGRYRYSEERIPLGAPLYAIGNFSTLDGHSGRPGRSEAVRALLAQWKQDQAGLVRQYDLNSDGEVDAGEWEVARRAAQAQVDRENQAFEPPAAQHILSASKTGRPFLLSATPQLALARHYRLWAGGGLVVFLLGGGMATWLLSTRFIGA